MFSWLFGSKQKQKDQLFEKVKKILDDEAYQTSLEPTAELQRKGLSVDILPNTAGEFGSATNPIPVNGVLGEMTYLSRLETLDGQRIFFHRYCSISSIDIYEVVTFGSNEWRILCFDMYHPRRSKLAPAGFRVSNEVRQFSGFNHYCQQFPYDFENEKAKNTLGDLISLGYIAPSIVLKHLNECQFIRSDEQKYKLEVIEKARAAFMANNNELFIELITKVD